MSNQNTPNECEVLLIRDEYGNSMISGIASTTNVLNTTNHDGTVGIDEGNVAAAATAAMRATTMAPFHLPDGRLMDGKNTLQSFDVAATAQRQQQQQNIGATIAPSTMKPPAPVLPLENNVPTNNNVDNINRNNNNNIVDGNPQNENVIRAQAVPVQSMVVAEGEIFHPSDYMTPAATTPTATATNPMGGRKSTAFWVATSIAIIFAMMLVGVVAGVGVYCGTGNCGGSGSTNPSALNPTISPVALTKVPVVTTVSPVTSPTTTRPINKQLRLACNFLFIFNLTACQRTTEYTVAASGNTIPTEIGLLTQITYLDLYNNQLNGTIPSTLGNLVQLTTLWLSGNQLTGTVPSTLGNLTQLKTLGLYNNQLSGTIPSTLGQLTQLNYLDSSNNQLTGSIPSTLGNLTQLTSLGLASNQLTGTIPSTLGNLTQLDYLYLFNNTQLSGTIPSVLCSVSSDISIGIDCDNIVCTCCLDGYTYNSDTFLIDGSCPTTR